MDADNLVRMANRIGDFFEAQPERQEALEGVAMHLRRYWEPRMRRQLLLAVDAGAPDLKALVREAIAQHRTTLL